METVSFDEHGAHHHCKLPTHHTQFEQPSHVSNHHQNAPRRSSHLHPCLDLRLVFSGAADDEQGSDCRSDGGTVGCPTNLVGMFATAMECVKYWVMVVCNNYGVTRRLKCSTGSSKWKRKRFRSMSMELITTASFQHITHSFEQPSHVSNQHQNAPPSFVSPFQAHVGTYV